jgi:hypothetical protein
MAEQQANDLITQLQAEVLALQEAAVAEALAVAQATAVFICLFDSTVNRCICLLTLLSIAALQELPFDSTVNRCSTRNIYGSTAAPTS